MSEEASIRNLSETILSFNNWNRPQDFEAYVLERTTDIKEKEVFKKIWATAIDFDNWNTGSLNDGSDKAIALIEQRYQLDEKVSKQIANAAAFQWK